MIAKTLDYIIRQAPLIFCVGFLAATALAFADLPTSGSGKKQTRISANQSNYNSERNTVQFSKDVTLVNPQMKLTCDELDVKMLREANGPAAAATGAIQSAIAKGFVVIHATTAAGKKIIAHAKRADYDALTQTVVLSGQPRLQDGAQLVEGTAPESKITLTGEGEHSTNGPTKVTIDSPQSKSLNLPR
ncbi:MAG: LptA/OstA family protein [Verrucomicrobiota bacterium]